MLSAILLALAVFMQTPGFQSEVGIGFRHEPGVETKVLFPLSATASTRFGAAFQGSLALSAGDNPGIAAYGLGGELLLLRPIRLRFRAGANHNQWSSWRVGENSVWAMVLAAPLRRLELGVGAGWRVPVLDTAAYSSPLRWQGPASEWNPLYRVQWAFIERPAGGLAVWIANDDRQNPTTPQQFPFGLGGFLGAGPKWRLKASVGSNIKGLSGALFSLGEVNARVGVNHVF